MQAYNRMKRSYTLTIFLLDYLSFLYMSPCVAWLPVLINVLAGGLDAHSGRMKNFHFFLKEVLTKEGSCGVMTSRGEADVCTV